MKIKKMLYKYRLALILVIVILAFYIVEPKFLSFTNLTNVLWSVALIGIMAAGAIYPIITGGIDLSVGGIAGFTSVVLAFFMVHQGVPFGVALLIVFGFGIGFGLANGILVTKFRIPAFITTMAMLNIVSGIAMVWSDGKTTSIMNPPAFIAIGMQKVFSVPLPVFIMLGIMLISFWLLNKSSFGRKIIATGGNKTAAEMSGVSTDKITILGYVVSSVCAVLSGLVIASMTQQGRATMAKGYEMDVITAIILGGASLSGGKGSIWGTLFGVVLIGLISNGMTLLNAPSEWHGIVKGLIIVVTVAFESFVSMRSRKVKPTSNKKTATVAP